MGKVLKAVAIIAVAVAIAYFAPQLTPAFLSSAFGTAVATSIVATALSAVAGMAFQALTYAPGEQPSGYRRGFRELDGPLGSWVEREPPAPFAERLEPIRAAWWRDPIFYPWQRLAIVSVRGDCMVPVLPSRRCWVLVDRLAPIAPGDLFVFGLDDLFTSYLAADRRWWARLTGIGMVKRYLGTEPAVGKVIFDLTNPPTLCETGRERFIYAYRVAGTASSWWMALRALWSLHSRAHAE